MDLLEGNLQIMRITEMEKLFDTVTDAFYEGLFRPEENKEHGEMLRTLKEYYEGPLWKLDYASDERGDLPEDLIRGVLSQDGLYDLLTDIEEGNF